MSQKGFTHFIPLVVIAVLLIGVVGYFSVTRIKNDVSRSVLSKSDEADTDVNEDNLAQGTSEPSASPDEFESEAKELEKLNDLNFSDDGLGIDFNIEDEVTNSGSVDKVEKTETKDEGKFVQVKGTKTLKLFGLFPIETPVNLVVNSVTGETVSTTNENTFVKLLPFLFSRD